MAWTGRWSGRIARIRWRGHDSWQRGTEVDEEAGEERQVEGDRDHQEGGDLKGHPGDQAAASDPCCQLLMCSIDALISMNPSLHWSHLGIRNDIF